MSRRSSPVFYPRRRPQSEGRVFDYAGWSAEALDAVRRIVEAKRAAGVVPAMATWIELKRRLRPEVMQRLDHLVMTGRLTAKESLNYRLYGLPREKEEMNEKQR